MRYIMPLTEAHYDHIESTKAKQHKKSKTHRAMQKASRKKNR